MAAPVLAGRGTVSVVTTGNITHTVAASVAANDIVLVVAALWTGNQPAETGWIWNDPSNGGPWTTLGSWVQTTGVPPTTLGGGRAWWMRATGAYTSLTMTRPAGSDTGADTALGLQTYRVTGCETSGNPFDDVDINDGVGTTVTYGAITVSGSERTLVAVQWITDNVATGTPPTGYTLLGAADNSGTGTDFGAAAYHLANVSSDGQVTNTITAPTNGRWAALHLSFKPPSLGSLAQERREPRLSSRLRDADPWSVSGWLAREDRRRIAAEREAAERMAA